MIMWDKVIMKKEDAVFDGLIDDQYILYNDDKSILQGCYLIRTYSRKELKVSIHYQIQPTVGFVVDRTFDKVQKIAPAYMRSQCCLFSKSCVANSKSAMYQDEIEKGGPPSPQTLMHNNVVLRERLVELVCHISLDCRYHGNDSEARRRQAH